MKPLFAVLIGLALSILHPYKLDDLPPEHSLVHRYNAAAAYCIKAIDLEMPDATDGEREKYARQLFEWSYEESSWFVSPYACKVGTVGCLPSGVLAGTNDDGNGCGLVQTHVDEIQSLSNWKGVLDPTWTCKAVRHDGVLGFRVAIRVLKKLEADCGSTAAAWSAYAGKLGCATYIKPLVKQRCKRAGLTELCELPEAA